ncbi:DUF6332 family protein [Streptomyces sp. NPDC097619]|uniref:DUF6332 family protein n=1 Tax=Streptomyces sp. NPDC097619 TaxID=3157228 RepID=UPI0033245210
MDMGRESRVEKDAMTVEIVFALVTAAFLAALVYGPFLLTAHLSGASGRVRDGLLTTGTVLAGVAGIWRVVRVLTRFDARRRLGR